MSSPIPPNLFRLTPPTLPSGYCPATWQNFVNDIFGGAQITILITQGTFIYNYGSTTPAPENRIYPWLNTTTGLWYTYQFGYWIAPVSPTDLVDGFRRIYLPAAGTLESAVWSLDGGDGTDPSVSGNVTVVTGAMWEVDHTMDGRVPIGAGEIPGTSPAISVSIAQTVDSDGASGLYEVTLSTQNMPSHDHGMPQGTVDDPAATYCEVPVNIAGTDWRGNDSPTAEFAHFVPEGGDADGVTVPHLNMQPYRAVWFLKHTARLAYTLPG